MTGPREDDHGGESMRRRPEDVALEFLDRVWGPAFQTHLLDARTENVEAFANPAEDCVVSRWVHRLDKNGERRSLRTNGRGPH